MNNPKKMLRSLMAVVLSLGSGAVCADTAGHVQFVNGDVSLTTSSGGTHRILKGEAIDEGDTLTAAKSASAQIRMQDGGIIALRPDTVIKFDSFKYNGQEDGTERSFFSLLKGGFRAITGVIGRTNKSSYRITTPTSTIGIRGTDHESIVVVPGSELAVLAPSGTYNKVNVGETSITTDKGMIAVRPNQMGYAGAVDELPKLQPINSALFTAAPAAGPGQNRLEKTEDQGKNGKETDGKKEESNDDTVPVREKAVVDEAPSVKVAGSSTSPANDGVTGVAVVAPPVVIQASGQTVNLNNQTITTAAGATTMTTQATATAAYVQTDLAVAFATSDANYLHAFTEIGTLIAAAADVNNTLPNPSLIDRYTGKNSGSSVSYSLNGTTTVGQAATTLANGIQFGRYDSTSSQKVVVGNTSCCTAGTYPSPGPVFSHWIIGPAVNPVYLPEALTGTVNYRFSGGTTPTSSFVGTAVTLDSATLSVNFTQQMVAFNLGLIVGGAAWGASAAAPLEGLYWNSANVGFRASTVENTSWAALTVTGGATSGDVVGQLTGNALDGALMSYVLSGTSNQVAGVAAFTGTPANTATSYRVAALSTVDTTPVSQVNAGLVVPVMMGGYNNASNVLFDAAGNAVQFNANKPFSNAGGANTLNIGTAAAVGLGTDAVSGISWGRWQGGTLTLTNIATTVASNLANASSSHWIVGPVMTTAVDLPISGTYSYVLGGGTAPTDSLGGVGTLNSASLTANFTAQTVDFGMNVTTPNAGNLVASGVNIPIEQKNFFNASTANSPNGGANLGLLTVTCASGCGTAAAISGNVGGVFVGAAGIGVGMAYGLSNGSVNVNGVAAFHR